MCWAQTNPITNAAVPRLAVKPGQTVTCKVQFLLSSGYHTNSHTPSDEYLIPLKLTWDPSPLEVAGIDYPKPQMEKYGFSDKPLSVYTSDFEIATRFKAPANAPTGNKVISGKLRYQACTTTSCLAPKVLTFSVPVDIR